MSDTDALLRPEPPRRPNGVRALATLGRFLTDDGWRPQPVGPSAFRIAYSGKAGPLELRAEVLVEAEQLVITGTSAVLVPSERRPAANEYLRQASFGLYVGTLELDMERGAARARCGLDFEGEPLSPRLIRNALAITVRLLETYLPGLLLVIEGSEPSVALSTVEG